MRSVLSHVVFFAFLAAHVGAGEADRPTPSRKETSMAIRTVGFDVELSIAVQRDEGDWTWFGPRAAPIPDPQTPAKPTVLMSQRAPPMLRILITLALLFGVSSTHGDGIVLPKRDKHSSLLLRVKANGTALEDVAGEAPLQLKGGRIVADRHFGHVVQFGDDSEHSISVTDSGRCDFTKGFTFEAWVNVTSSDESPNAGGSLAAKRGSFSFGLSKKLGLDNQEMRFPRVPIVTTDEKQLNYFPVGNCRFYGATSIPTGQWVHLAVTYEPDREVIRTWIDGSEDRVRYLTRSEYGTTLQCDPDAPLTLLDGVKHVKVGAVHVSGVARAIGPASLLETYVHQLPWQQRIVLQFAHLGSELPYPLQTSVTWCMENIR